MVFPFVFGIVGEKNSASRKGREIGRAPVRGPAVEYHHGASLTHQILKGQTLGNSRGDGTGSSTGIRAAVFVGLNHRAAIRFGPTSFANAQTTILDCHVVDGHHHGTKCFRPFRAESYPERRRIQVGSKATFAR